MTFILQLQLILNFSLSGTNLKIEETWLLFFLNITSVEAKVLILWPPDVKNWLIGKDPDAGKD